MDEKWTAIARTGTFTDSEGRAHHFTTKDLDNIAAAYAPERQKSPLVLGHPKDNDPALGWVQAVKREGQKLFASFAQVPVNVRQMLDTGRYKYVSMSLMPDRVTLRHVGLLGAARPAMDGLGEISFCEDTEGITINFAAPAEGATMPTLEELQQKVIDLQQQLEGLRAENSALKAKCDEAETEKDKAEQAAKATGADFAAFRQTVEGEKREARVGKLIAEGKLAPTEKATTLEFCAALAKVPGPVNFSAAGSEQVQISAEERYWRELEARPVDGRFVDFAAPAPAHAVQATAPVYSSAAMAQKL